MHEIQQSTANSVMVRMIASSDHITGMTGLTLAVAISKDGGGFNSITPVVTERGSGWYNIDLTATHCDTLGELVVMATAAGSDPGVKVLYVVEYLSITTSEVSICNMALARCGVTILIQSATEASNQADICNLFYAPTRDRVLEAFNWPFARRIATLADIGAPPINWQYRYRYPVDCLKVRNLVVEGMRAPNKDNRIPFQVLGDEASSAKAIVTDQISAIAEYTARITDVNLFPPAFVSALAWGLAVEIAIPLTTDMKRVQVAQQMYLSALRDAESTAAGEQEEEPMPESDFITARL